MSFWTNPLPGVMRNQVASLPIEFVGSAFNRSVGSVTVSKPAGLTEGDFLVAFVARSGAFPLPIAPTGWDLSHSNSGSSPAVFYKAATPTEPSSYTFTGSTFETSCTVLAYRNASRISAYSEFASGAGGTGVSTAISIVMPKVGCLIAAYSLANSGATIPSNAPGMTRMIFETSGNPCVAVYHNLEQPAGATGDKSITWSVTNSRFATLIGLD